MSPRRIPAARYTSPEWQALEDERLWTRVWQIACSVDCVREPGDAWVYDVGSLSIVVVRDRGGALRAFQNACRHRGSLLLREGRTGLAEIRCRYHHWCYDLAGRLKPEGATPDAPGREGPMGLRPVAVDTWGPFVFVNPDANAEPLGDYLETLPEELAWVGMADFTCADFMTVEVECNWKTVVDAFIETYHLHAVHPQMLAIADDVNTPIRLFDKHSMFLQPYGVPSPRRNGTVSDQELWAEFVRNLGHRLGLPFAAAEDPGPHPEIPPGQTLRDVLVQRIRAHLATVGPRYADLDDAHVIDDYHYHVFPNAVLNVFAGWFGLIRARPGPTPGTALLDMWNFDPVRADDATARARPTERVLGPEEIAALGPVLGQDLDLLPDVQRGLAQPGTDVMHLVAAEARIGRMHEVLDRVIEPPEAWRLPED